MTISPPSRALRAAEATGARRPQPVYQQVLYAVLSLASALVFIRVVGMLNQLVISSHFGAGATMDAYLVASSVPGLTAQLLVSMLQGSVVPGYARTRQQAEHDEQAARDQTSRLFSTLLNLLLMGAAVLMLAMLVVRQQMIFVAAPALDPPRREMAIALTPFTVPALLLMLACGFLECTLNAKGQYGWPAYAGLLVPLSTIMLVLLASRWLGITALALGTLVGLVLQLGIMVVRVRRARIVYRPILDLRNPALAAILTSAWPLLISESLVAGSPFVDQVMASFLSTGSISALSYSQKLISLPLGIVAATVGRAVLPHLAGQAAERDIKALKQSLRLSVWAVGSITALLAVFLLVVGHPLVQILFQRGAFTSDDTDRTAATLLGFVVGLVPMAVGFIVPTAFNALGKTRILMYVAVFSVVANAVLDTVLARLWQSVGIAVATSAVYLAATCLQFIILRRMIGKLNLFSPPIEVWEVLRQMGH